MDNQIMISGKKLFYKNGYFKTKVSDIMTDIGVSTGNFYTYYSSKEVLLDKILREQLNYLEREFEIHYPEYPNNESEQKPALGQALLALVMPHAAHAVPQPLVETATLPDRMDYCGQLFYSQTVAMFVNPFPK